MYVVWSLFSMSTRVVFPQLRKLGEDDNEGDLAAVEGTPATSAQNSAKWISLPNPDGLVREVKERRVISRKETEELKETEDVQHLGDITDKVSVKSS